MKEITKIKTKNILERSFYIGATPVVSLLCVISSPFIACLYAKNALESKDDLKGSNKWSYVLKSTLPAFTLPFKLPADILSDIYKYGSARVEKQKEKEKNLAEEEYKKSDAYKICEYIKNSNEIKNTGCKKYLVKDGLMLIDMHTGTVKAEKSDVKIIRLKPEELRKVSKALQSRCAELMNKDKQR